jgi:hypothetical protein
MDKGIQMAVNSWIRSVTQCGSEPDPVCVLDLMAAFNSDRRALLVSFAISLHMIRSIVKAETSTGALESFCESTLRREVGGEGGG